MGASQQVRSHARNTAKHVKCIADLKLSIRLCAGLLAAPRNPRIESNQGNSPPYGILRISVLVDRLSPALMKLDTMDLQRIVRF